MKRVVVYAGTRNVYHNMAVAAKSLLYHTHVDRVWFLIEDDTFPEELPDVIKTKNVSGQKWFDEDGPNARKRWSYMALMKLALCELFPDEDRVTWLDIDTIVNKDIGPLLDMDLEGNYYGMAEEPIRSKRPFKYYNAGVLVMDLERLRDGKAQEMLKFSNIVEMDFPDQDVINLLCQGRIKAFDPYYNSNKWIVDVSDPAITHFAADRNYTNQSLFREYDLNEWRVI